MILTNLEIAGDPVTNTIRIKNGYIDQLSVKSALEPEAINCKGALLFPGLINSHDHLDFNLFPQLGNRVYQNYVEWGNDIHLQNKEEIARVLAIPQELRIQWGIYKNLLNGITTVVNHGLKISADENLVSVFQDCQVIHSVQLVKNWKLKLNFSANKSPVVVHVGEGTDRSVSKEIDQLLKWNLFRKSLIGVHGVAMTVKQSKGFKALIWSAESNLFLLNKTAEIDELKKHIPILFGTDSTLTASWNVWQQLRLAESTGMANGQELLEMLTNGAAAVWKLHDRGSIKPGKRADLILMKPGTIPFNPRNFSQLNPEDLLMVIHKGEINLLDETFAEHCPDPANFSSILVNQSRKLVKGNIPALMKEISGYYPGVNFPVSE